MSSDHPGPDTDPARQDDPEPKSLAARLDHLFKFTADAYGHEDSYRTVAAAIETAGGPTVSASYLHQLRTGQKDNPTKRHLEALATYFGVPPAYFFDEALAEKVDAQLALLLTLRDTGVMNVALRARGLSPASLDMLAHLLDQTRYLEGLDDHTKRAVAEIRDQTPQEEPQGG